MEASKALMDCSDDNLSTFISLSFYLIGMNIPGNKGHNLNYIPVNVVELLMHLLRNASRRKG